MAFLNEAPFLSMLDEDCDGNIKDVDDMGADDCIKKINEWEQYRQFWLDYYAKKVAEVNDKCDRNIDWQKRNLQFFFNTVPHRRTKTMEAYDLPSGRISIKSGKRKMVPDNDAILERFKRMGRTEFIRTKVKEELDWANYKNKLFISESGEVFDSETGEQVPDVAVEETEAKFEVTLNNKKNGEENNGTETEAV